MASLRQGYGIVRQIDTRTLPVSQERRESAAAASFLIFFSLVFGAISLYSLVWAILNRMLAAASLITMVLFILIAIGVLIFGLSLLVKMDEITISHDSVFLRHRGLFSSYEWEESLAGYEGVLLRMAVGGKRSYNIIELHHARPERCIDLAVYLMTWIPENEVRARWEDYSRQLNLSALQQTSEGIAGRKPSDLDRPIGEIAREAGAGGALPDISAPPQGLTLAHAGGSEIVSVNVKKTMTPSTLGLLAFCAVMTAIGIAKSDNIRYLIVGAFGMLLAAYALIYTVFDLITKMTVRVEAGLFHFARKTPFGEIAHKMAEAAKIEEILITRGPYQKFDAVTVVTDKFTVRIGEKLSNDALQWLKGYLIRKAMR